MSESIIKTQVLDDVSPEVRKLMDSLSPEGRRKLLRRLAHLLVEDAKRNFDDPANRPEPWADKKVYKRGRGLFSMPSNLKDTGSLLKSIKLKYLDGLRRNFSKPRLHRLEGRKARGRNTTNPTLSPCPRFKHSHYPFLSLLTVQREPPQPIQRNFRFAAFAFASVFCGVARISARSICRLCRERAGGILSGEKKRKIMLPFTRLFMVATKE